MIPFFRKLRKQLASDNKPLKYMRYAIGEIVLVVIGILIALSINNWNQDRQQRQKEKQILIELQRDLVSNDSILQHEINFQQNTVDEIKATIDHLKNKKPFNDTISVYLKRTMYTELILFVSSSYESLKSVGVDIISSVDLRADIVNLFGNEFPRVATWINDEGRAQTELLSPFYIKYFEFTDEINPVALRFVDKTRLIVDYNNLLKNQEFINAISKKRALKKGIAGNLKRLQVQVKKTIRDIDKELETF